MSNTTFNPSVQTFSLTTGGTAQLLVAANPTRQALAISPITENVFINFGATAGIQATGTYTLAAKPSVNDTLIFNGVTFTFVASSASAVQITIGATLATAITNALATLNASTNPSVNVATYSNVSGNPADGIITVTYILGGTIGNAYTLNTTTGGNVTRSGATLTGGVVTRGGFPIAAGQAMSWDASQYSSLREDIYIVSPTSAAYTAYLEGII